MKKSLISAVDVCLSPLGFYRHNNAWNRRSDVFVDVIDLQKSKVGNDVTLNLGVHNLKLNKQYGFRKNSDFIDEQYCAVRTRFGFLIGNKDIWWDLAEPNLANIIKDSILNVGLPFLNNIHSDAAMERFLTDAKVEKKQDSPSIIYLALLRNELGEKSDGCSLLLRLRSVSSPPWQKTLDEIMKKLDCKMS